VLLRVAVVVVVFAIVAAIGWWFERHRRTDAPPQSADQVPGPRQLDRADFARPEAPWLVALFTSATCESCQGLYDKAKPLESPDVVVVECEFPRERELHARYHIEAAPLTVVADGRGVVHATLVGAYDATELWTTVAEVRNADGERQEP